MSSPRNAPTSPISSNRVKVTGLSSSSTETSVREFFSFCGDIKLLHLYPSSSNPEEQEAVILFESDAGSSTAILLDNAVVDGNRIRVEIFPESPKASSNSEKGGRRSPAASETSRGSKGMLSDMMSEGKSMASDTWRSAKEADKKYEISDKVKGAATTVAGVTVSAAKSVDEKLHVRENASAAWSATKQGVSSFDNKFAISSTVYGWFGWDKERKSASPKPSSTSPKMSSPSYEQ
jgi:RNA recognition motif-containing protein